MLNRIAFQERLRAARGARSREAVAESATQIPGAPDGITGDRVRRIETAEVIPRDGAELRAVAATLEVSWVQLLTDAGYWPPLGRRAGPQSEAQELLSIAIKVGGWHVTRSGKRIILETP